MDAEKRTTEGKARTVDAEERTKGFRPQPFPRDFPERLEGLKEQSGLSWKEFSACLGAKSGRVREWRRGVKPRGGAVWTIMRLAWSVPGGIEVMLPEDAGSGQGEE